MHRLRHYDERGQLLKNPSRKQFHCISNRDSMNYLKFFLLLFLLFDCLRSHVEASVQLNKFGIEFILDIQYWILKEPISKFLTSRSLMVRLRGKVKRNALLLVSRKVGAAGAQFFLEGTKVSTRELFRFYLFSCSLICQNS